MHRKFIALVIGATVAITSLSAAAPARADSEDLARALAGIAALAIIGKAIHDRRKDDDVVTRRTGRGPIIEPRPLPRRVARRALPAQCLRHAETDRGPRRVFGARCLERHYRHAHTLPRDCGRRVWTHRGWRYGYGVRCLRNRGYEIARY